MSDDRRLVMHEAFTWLGTPYHHLAQLKGVGVDCARLLIGVYCGLGLARPVEPGFYATDWNQHRGEELFEHWVTEAGAHMVASPGLGDMALFRYGRTYSHGAIIVSEGEPWELVHALRTAGEVVRTRIDEAPLHGREVHYWSIF